MRPLNLTLNPQPPSYRSLPFVYRIVTSVVAQGGALDYEMQAINRNLDYEMELLLMSSPRDPNLPPASRPTAAATHSCA